MPAREHGAGPGPSYVLVLREHEDAGRGYSVELAPLLSGGATARAHGRGSIGEEAMATAAGTPPRSRGGILTRDASTGTSAATASRARGSSPAREAAGGTGEATASRARGGSPRREAATGTGMGAASRAHVGSPTREAATGRPRRARSGIMANALFLTPRALGHGTAVEVGTGTPPRAHGGRIRIAVATGGGAAPGACGDVAGGGADDLFVGAGDYDPTAAAREHILEDMTNMLFSPSESVVTLEELPKINADSKSVPEVLIPVFMSPNMKKEDDDTWNKRQIMYIFVLTTTAGLVFLLQPFLPPAFGRWIIMVAAVAWGAGSIGLPCGLHGTARCEKECSRHVGRFIYTLFSVLVIYGFYLAAMRIDNSPAPTPSPSLQGVDHMSAYSNGNFWWSLCFGTIGLFVLLGNLWSSVKGCWTGGDRDP